MEGKRQRDKGGGCGGRRGRSRAKRSYEDEKKVKGGIWTVIRDKRWKPVEGLHPTTLNEI